MTAVNNTELDVIGMTSESAGEVVPNMLNQPEEQYAFIPASALDDNPFNPRRFFEESALKELADDFRMQGQSTPCVVRDIGNGRYQVAAGHRRVRAGRMAFGPEGRIKCLIRELNDAQMHHLAVTENKLRESTSVIDEAEACQRMLELCDGDRASAAAHMHMNIFLFDRRLALLALGELSRQALAEKKIWIGVAELLASVPEKMQDKVLPQIIEQKLSVDFVREEVLRVARPLGDAIFDKSDCDACPFNSDRQQGLFDTVIAVGNCTNAPCYRKKTLVVIEGKEEELKAQYPRVLVIHKVDTPKGIALNEAELGEAQVTLCKGCKDFGASISNLPGSYGATVEGVCLNGECHTDKKKVHRAATRAKNASAPSVITGHDTQAIQAIIGGAEAPEASEKPKTSGITKAVKEFRSGLWRAAINGVAERKPVEARIALLALAADHQAGCLDNEVVSVQCHKATTLEARLLSYGHDEIETDLTSAIAKMVSKANEVSLPVLLKHFDCDLSEFFCADEAFLKLLTRSELESYAEQVGLKAAMGMDEWKKSTSGKKDEAIKAYLNVSGFDFSRVPTILIPQSDQ